MPFELRILVHSYSESCPGASTPVSDWWGAAQIAAITLPHRRFSVSRLCRLLDYGFVLLDFGDMGNNLQSVFIFFTNTRYASRASVCVGYVLLRFIHIFRYLSELVSFSAAYHSPDDVCFRTMARRLPPNPVTPLTCLRQAALSSETSVLSSAGSSA